MLPSSIYTSLISTSNKPTKCKICGRSYEQSMVTLDYYSTCTCEKGCEPVNPIKYEKSMAFQDVFAKIKEYHDALGQQRHYDTEEQRMQSVRNLSLAAIIEMVEMIDSLPWKPWREIDKQSRDIENFKREVIDVIFFLAAVCEDIGVDGRDLEEKFKEVMANNIRRLTNGYSKTDYTKERR